MAKLIKLDEAAQILGISPEALTEMRNRNEISGYRDGSTWKFKMAELERVKAQLGTGTQPAPELSDTLDDLSGLKGLDLESGEMEGEGSGSLSLDDISLDDLSLDAEADGILDLDDNDDSDSILVSEEELGQSDENTASTIIGEADDLALDDGDSRGSGDALGGESDLELSLEASDVLGDLGDKPASASDTANIEVTAASGDELNLQSDSGSLDMSLDEISEASSRIELVDDDAKASSSGFGSAIDLGLDDDELVLGSGTGSDVTLGAGDSGINLGNPSDSGLSLEEPLELSAGSGVDGLELGEDDMLDLDESLVGQVDHADDDFMLTPVEDGLDEESDSGSQVIALDGEEFDESAVSMLSDDDAESLEGEHAEFMPDDEGLGAVSPVAGAMPVGPRGDDEDANYSIWNVLSLFSIVLLLGFTGILMLDLINNIWSWGGTYSFNSTIMDAILGMLPG